MSPPLTPDHRYIVVRGRLWRAANPQLSAAERSQLQSELSSARSRVRSADPEAKAKARSDVNRLKHALGERGPAWWDDGAPDYNRHLAKNTPYRGWFEHLADNDAEGTS